MVNARGKASLIQEHLHELFFILQVRVQTLDGVHPLEPTDPCQTRQVHSGHAARRYFAYQLVAIDELTSARLHIEKLCTQGDLTVERILRSQ